MRYRSLFFLFILFLSVSANKNGNSPLVGLVTEEIYFSTSTDYTKPRVSPNGKYFMVTREGNYGVYIFDLKRGKLVTSIKQQARIGFSARWTKDSQSIVYSEKIGLKSKVYQTDINYPTNHTEINISHDAIQSYVLITELSDPMVYVNPITFQIEASTLNGKSKWPITNDHGRYYNPLLSPNKTKIIVNDGAEMYVFNADGSGGKTALTQGVPTCWHPTENKFIYFLDTSTDGHQITDSEIYIYDLDAKTSINLTNSPGKIELWPSISDDGKTMVYEDMKQHQVYVSKLTK